MLASKQTILFLSITCFIFLLLIFFLSRKKNNNQTHKLFICLCSLLALWLIELILQAVLSKPLGINPIYFDYFVYINTCLLPVIFLLLSISFTDTKFKFNKKYFLFLLLISVFSFSLLLCNNSYPKDMKNTITNFYKNTNSFDVYLSTNVKFKQSDVKQIKDLKEENLSLRQSLSFWKDKFLKVISFIKDKLFGKEKEREKYMEVVEDLYSKKIIDEYTFENLQDTYEFSKNHDYEREKDDFDLSI